MANMFNRFVSTPSTLHKSRSGFDLSHSLLTTMSVGHLVPILVDEVLPGDTRKISVTQLLRATTPVLATMDTSYCDIAGFVVPLRLLWSHFKEFFGENTAGPWAPSTSYIIPQAQLMCSDNSKYNNSFYDYIGIPSPAVNNSAVTISDLYSRAYKLIWNEWYRDQNTQTPITIDKGDGMYIPDIATEFNGDNILKVNKLHDYFTSALPAPVKGSVNLSLSGQLPVLTGTSHQFQSSMTHNFATLSNSSNTNVSSGPLASVNSVLARMGTSSNPTANEQVTIDNMYVDLNNTTITLENIRQATAILHLFENRALYGSRYREQIASSFGVSISDTTDMVPRYCFGFRTPININEVVQNSATSDTPLGTTAGNSVTINRSSGFKISSQEHAIFMVFAYIRTNQSYQNGIEKQFLRKTDLDFYWPELAHISNQKIDEIELFVSDSETVNNRAFGYQEYAAPYRYKSNRVSGLMRSTSSGGTLINNYAGFDVYHYANSFSSAPVLNSSFMVQDSNAFKRTLAITNQPDFFANFYFNYQAYRVMPVYSVPGLGKL